MNITHLIDYTDCGLLVWLWTKDGNEAEETSIVFDTDGQNAVYVVILTGDEWHEHISHHETYDGAVAYARTKGIHDSRQPFQVEIMAYVLWR